ncbi:MAG: hypothetical protein R3E89_09575 [Thiolinea sp.]
MRCSLGKVNHPAFGGEDEHPVGKQFSVKIFEQFGVIDIAVQQAAAAITRSSALSCLPPSL